MEDEDAYDESAGEGSITDGGSNIASPQMGALASPKAGKAKKKDDELGDMDAMMSVDKKQVAELLRLSERYVYQPHTVKEFKALPPIKAGSLGMKADPVKHAIGMAKLKRMQEVSLSVSIDARRRRVVEERKKKQKEIDDAIVLDLQQTMRKMHLDAKDSQAFLDEYAARSAKNLVVALPKGPMAEDLVEKAAQKNAEKSSVGMSIGVGTTADKLQLVAGTEMPEDFDEWIKNKGKYVQDTAAAQRELQKKGVALMKKSQDRMQQILHNAVKSDAIVAKDNKAAPAEAAQANVAATEAQGSLSTSPRRRNLGVSDGQGGGKGNSEKEGGSKGGRAVQSERKGGKESPSKRVQFQAKPSVSAKGRGDARGSTKSQGSAAKRKGTEEESPKRGGKGKDSLSTSGPVQMNQAGGKGKKRKGDSEDENVDKFENDLLSFLTPNLPAVRFNSDGTVVQADKRALAVARAAQKARQMVRQKIANDEELQVKYGKKPPPKSSFQIAKEFAEKHPVLKLAAVSSTRGAGGDYGSYAGGGPKPPVDGSVVPEAKPLTKKTIMKIAAELGVDYGEDEKDPELDQELGDRELNKKIIHVLSGGRGRNRENKMLAGAGLPGPVRSGSPSKDVSSMGMTFGGGSVLLAEVKKEYQERPRSRSPAKGGGAHGKSKVVKREVVGIPRDWRGLGAGKVAEEEEIIKQQLSGRGAIPAHAPAAARKKSQSPSPDERGNCSYGHGTGGVSAVVEKHLGSKLIVRKSEEEVEADEWAFLNKPGGAINEEQGYDGAQLQGASGDLAAVRSKFQNIPNLYKQLKLHDLQVKEVQKLKKDLQFKFGAGGISEKYLPKRTMTFMGKGRGGGGGMMEDGQQNQYGNQYAEDGMYINNNGYGGQGAMGMVDGQGGNGGDPYYQGAGAAYNQGYGQQGYNNDQYGGQDQYAAGGYSMNAQGGYGNPNQGGY